MTGKSLDLLDSIIDRRRALRSGMLTAFLELNGETAAPLRRRAAFDEAAIRYCRFEAAIEVMTHDPASMGRIISDELERDLD